MTRLGDFSYFLVTNFVRKVAQISHLILGYFEKHNFIINIIVATFWQLLEEFGLPYILTLGHSVCLFHSQRSAVQIQSSEKFIY